VPFHQYHHGFVRIKSLIIRVNTMHWPWLAVKMAVVFHFISFWKHVAQYENKQPFGSDKDFPGGKSCSAS